MKVLSGTVSHRCSERHRTWQCSRHRFSRCSEATLNIDIQGKIQHPKVSEVGLQSSITQIGLRLCKLPLDIKVNKKIFQRIGWLLKSIIVISVSRSNIYASLWADSLDPLTEGSLDPYGQKQYEENHQWLEIEDSVIPVHWASACSPPQALCRHLPHSSTPFFPPHVLFTLLTGFLGGTHIEARWDSSFRWTSNATLNFVAKLQMKKTMMRINYQLGLKGFLFWGVFLTEWTIRGAN